MQSLRCGCVLCPALCTSLRFVCLVLCLVLCAELLCLRPFAIFRWCPFQWLIRVDITVTYTLVALLAIRFRLPLQQNRADVDFTRRRRLLRWRGDNLNDLSPRWSCGLHLNFRSQARQSRSTRHHLSFTGTASMHSINLYIFISNNY